MIFRNNSDFAYHNVKAIKTDMKDLFDKIVDARGDAHNPGKREKVDFKLGFMIKQIDRMLGDPAFVRIEDQLVGVRESLTKMKQANLQYLSMNN